MTKPAYNPAQKNTVAANPSAPSTPGSKKLNPKVVAGAAAGAAVIGVGGTAAAMNLNNDEAANQEDIDLDAQAEEIEIGTDGDFNPDAPAAGINIGSIFGGNTTSSTQHPTASQSQSANGTQPASQPAANTANQQAPANSQTPTQQQTPTTQQTSENSQTTAQHENNPEDPNDRPIDPDEVIALTEVDEDDNDVPELLSFESVELVPDEDGSVQIQAEFTMEGERYTMIDIDNDGVFDAIADAAGNAQGSAAGMMLSDIELINNENNSDYLAANEYDNNSDVSGTGESAVDDTVTI